MIKCYIKEESGLFAVKAHDSKTDKTITIVLKSTKEIAKRFADELLAAGQVDELQGVVENA